MKPCKDCVTEGVTTQRSAPHPGPRCATHHRAKRKADRTRNHGRHVERTFGITGDQYRELYEFQDGRCAICRRATGATRALAVDHDHETGVVRGLCCSWCNFELLGRLDTPALMRAIEYRLNPPAVQLFGKVVVPDGS